MNFITDAITALGPNLLQAIAGGLATMLVLFSLKAAISR